MRATFALVAVLALAAGATVDAYVFTTPADGPAPPGCCVAKLFGTNIEYISPSNPFSSGVMFMHQVMDVVGEAAYQEMSNYNQSKSVQIWYRGGSVNKMFVMSEDFGCMNQTLPAGFFDPANFCTGASGGLNSYSGTFTVGFGLLVDSWVDVARQNALSVQVGTCIPVGGGWTDRLFILNNFNTKPDTSKLTVPAACLGGGASQRQLSEVVDVDALLALNPWM